MEPSGRGAMKTFVTVLAAAAIPWAGVPEEPAAPVEPFEIACPAGSRTDPFYWMRNRDDPRVLALIEAENAYGESLMAGTLGLQESLYTEMAARMPPADSTAPYPYNGFLYWARYSPGMDYPVYMRRADAPGAVPEVLLDVNALAAGREYLDAWPVVDPQGRFAAVAIDTSGALSYDLVFLDLGAGVFLHDTLRGTDGEVAWGNDGYTLFYGLQDSTFRTDRIMRHSLGTMQDADEEVFRETDPTFWPMVSKSPSDEYVFIHSESSTSSEAWLLDADMPSGSFRLVQERMPGVEYSVTGLRDSLFILTNLDAPDFRVVRAPVLRPSAGSWREVVGHRDGILIEDVEVFPGHVAMVVRKDGFSEIRVFDRESRSERVVAGGDEPCSVALARSREPGSGVLRYEYSSPTTPPTIFDLDLASGATTLVHREEVPGYSPELYRARRVFVTSHDGVQVPMTLVWRQDRLRPGGNPLLLYGYGAYGISTDPWFSIPRISLMDRGFLCAIAHVRGGSEMGRSWYESGRLLEKRNTFLDFVACAEYLVEQGLTDPSMMFAMGESAGGLLMGAVANMRPDLFRGIVAGVPFVDVVTTMLDPGIPLTTNEYEEWGNPSDPVFYSYMLSYSPYDNVTVGDYPAMLVTAGWNDSQVCYWEPMKWVSKLRLLRTDDDPLVLRVDMGAGHAGSSGRFEWLRQVALEYAFMIDLLRR